MDCFYAAVEMRDRPELHGKPIAVGGSSDRRGVLCTSNYLARQFGVRSAMATAYAKRLCPDLVVLPVAMDKYREISSAIRAVFFEYTDLVEPLSLDEAFLDVSDCGRLQNSATLIAKDIRARIYRDHQITASAGIAANKFLAKIASDWNKPDGQFVVAPQQVAAFVENLAVEKIFGVGKVTAEKMHQLKIQTCKDLQEYSVEWLQQHFGRFGERLYYLSRGIDNREVEPNRERKSVSVEQTFVQDLYTVEACHAEILALFSQLQLRLESHKDKTIHKQFVKLKFNDFQQTSAETTVMEMNEKVFDTLLELAHRRQNKPVRLIGLGVGFKELDEVLQLDLPL